MQDDRLIRSAKEALAFADVERAIHRWVLEDAPVSVKMAMTPRLSRALAGRIVGAKVHEPPT